MKTIALILAGGSGTRLWPLSRQSMPKQLLSLTGNLTLLQDTCRRIFRLIPPDSQWIITGKEHYFQVLHQVEELQKKYPDICAAQEIDIIQEPVGRNTAPAILLAAHRCQMVYGNDSLLIVLPSDHLITFEDAFLESLEIGISKAAEGSLVTFGIQPMHPETGYGYIKTEKKAKSGRPVQVTEFVEKPDKAKAERYVKAGNYYWNSGMFVFHVGTLIMEAKKTAGDIIDEILQCNPNDGTEVAEVYSRIPARSIDYALMEKTGKAYMVPAGFGWSDVGSWQSFFEISPKDEQGNVITGKHVVLDSHNSLIYGKERTVVALGLEQIAIIDTPDAVMVSPLDQTQRIKEVVEKLKEQNNETYLNHKTIQRPWGSYTVIQEGPGYKIKKITVQPNQKLSMQMHYHRSEHWIVVRGTAKVTLEEKELTIHENESAFIPKITRHRLENPGHIPLEIIEAQCGNYLGEDDIIRYEDIYGR